MKRKERVRPAIAPRPSPQGAPGRPTASFVIITPAVAESFLARNTDNYRGLQSTVVARYARLMTDGHWRSDGNTIKVAHDGLLLDGQHRLHAVVKSGTTHEMLVVTNLDPTIADSLDRGAGRSVAQAVNHSGMRCPSAVASAAVILRQEETLGLSGGWHTRLEPQEALEVIAAHPGLEDSAVATRGVCKLFRASPGVFAWAHYRFSQVDPLLCQSFFDALAKNDTPTSDPITHLRKRIFTDALARNRMSRSDVASLLVRAWNATYEGRTVAKLQLSKQILTPEGELASRISFPPVAGLKKTRVKGAAA